MDNDEQQRRRDEKEKLHAKPRCCSPADWKEWSKACHVKPNSIDWHCTDCTPEFKARMMAAKDHMGNSLCDWPDVEFFLMPIIDEGNLIGHSIEGRRTSIPDYRGYPEGRKIIKIVDAKKGVYDLEPEKLKTL